MIHQFNTADRDVHHVLIKLAANFDVSSVLISNDEAKDDTGKTILAGFGCEADLLIDENNFGLIDEFTEQEDYVFTFLSYDLKNWFESLTSSNTDGIEFPDAYFFTAKFVVEVKNDEIHLLKGDTTKFQEHIDSIHWEKSSAKGQKTGIDLLAKMDKEDYLARLTSIKEHISLGDIYELNFCQEFYQAPFSAFCKYHSKFLLSTSPERYLKKVGRRLISQPIKGTAKRGESQAEDRKLKNELAESLKDKTENVMVVDLVRNDLGKCAKPGTVVVEELFGLYSFESVHQMISTISAELKDGLLFSDIIRYTFPMGSMTGVPKIRVMKLIEEYEVTKRGLYSGAVGYIDKKGDFDFNVVIRSILYRTDINYLSSLVGGAITAASIPEQEYNECLLKLKTIKEVLEGTP